MKGDLLDAIFGEVEVLPFAVLRGGVEGGRFCMRADRRGVVEGESIYSGL